MIFTILDFNVGLLQLFGRLLTPAPHVEERLAALPAAFRGSGADMVLLQEIYRESHRRFLSRALADLYPHASYVRKGRYWGLENGLMTMSRRPVATRFEPFRDAPFDEWLVDHKGVLITALERPRATLFNIHTTAGGLLLPPEARKTDAIRERQIDRILALAEGSLTIPIIAGDLNAGPGVSDGNYRLFETAGYVAVHAYLHGEEEDHTWDPMNALNEGGPHRTSPPQRIDHVFVRRADVECGRVRVLSSEIVFAEPVVQVANQGFVTLSDHYGMLVRLEIAAGA